MSMKADKKNIERLLKTARGQIDGILKMVDDDRYCLDISYQVMATQALLAKVNKEILKAHVGCCVRHAVETGDSDEKINEILELMDKIIK